MVRFHLDDLRAPNQLSLLYVGPEDVTDQLMTEAYSHNFECMTQSKSFLDILCKDLHIGMHLVDRVGAARDHDRIEGQ